MTHALHSNSIDDNGERIYGGEPAGLVIRMPAGFTVYHAGDTALFSDMKLIGELYKPDVALLPIGDHFTMGPRDPVSRREARGADALRDVSSFGGQTGTIEAGSQGYRWTGDSHVETWREPMIRSDNLRSAFTQEDVDKYIYDLLPERDAAVKEMEAYAAEHSVPIIGPAVARVLTLLVQVSGATRIFAMGAARGDSTIWLARAGGRNAQIL